MRNPRFDDDINDNINPDEITIIITMTLYPDDIIRTIATELCKDFHLTPTPTLTPTLNMILYLKVTTPYIPNPSFR